MPEPGSAPAPSRLFGTPLACALLSGALSVVTYEVVIAFYKHLVRTTGSVSAPGSIGRTALLLALTGTITTAQLLGAAIYWRNWTTLAKTLVGWDFTVKMGYLTLVLSEHNLIPNTHAVHFVSTLVSAGIKGALLAWLYRAPTKLRSAVYAMIATTPLLLVNFRNLTSRGDQTAEQGAFLWMFHTLTLIAIVVLPTLPIDRAFRDDPDLANEI